MCLEFYLKCGLVETCFGCDIKWTLLRCGLAEFKLRLVDVAQVELHFQMEFGHLV